MRQAKPSVIPRKRNTVPIKTFTHFPLAGFVQTAFGQPWQISSPEQSLKSWHGAPAQWPCHAVGHSAETPQSADGADDGADEEEEEEGEGEGEEEEVALMVDLIVELGVAETTMVARVVGEGALALTSSASLATVSTWAIVSRFPVAEVVDFDPLFAELAGVDGVEVGAVDELPELDSAALPPDPPPEADESPAPHNAASPVS